MRLSGTLLVALGCLSASGAALGGEVSDPVDVAPNAEGTQMQMWPRAAWAAGSGSWLVVWREGYINQEATDVWAGRVSADGKALDPTGICITKAPDRQERAVVASDGRGWLVVWEDFRNGKDYDVYAARVSPEGEVLDPDGFLVAGGEHNQCYPAVAFAGGNYVVVWQAFVGDYPDGTKDKNGRVSGYRLYGTTVSPKGKVTTPGGTVLTPANMWHALRPAAITAGDSRHVLVGFKAHHPGGGQQSTTIATLWVEGASGKTELRYQEPPAGDNRKADSLDGQPLAVAWGKDGGLVLSHRYEHLDEVSVWRLDESGARVLPEISSAKGHQVGFYPMYSVASDGQQYLVTRDRVVKQKPLPMLGVQARFLPADWKGGKDAPLDKEFFLVAGDGKRSCLMGHAAAGCEGAFLVTYTEARAVDNVRVLARVVKSHQESPPGK